MTKAQQKGRPFTTSAKGNLTFPPNEGFQLALFWSTAQLVAAQKGEEPEGEVLFRNVRFFWSYFGAVLSRYLGS